MKYKLYLIFVLLFFSSAAVFGQIHPEQQVVDGVRGVHQVSGEECLVRIGNKNNSYGVRITGVQNEGLYLRFYNVISIFTITKVD